MYWRLPASCAARKCWQHGCCRPQQKKIASSSLRAASARKVGQLPLLVLGLELAIPAAFQQHEHLRADYEENAEGGLSRRHGHSVLNLTLIVNDLCVLEVPTAQLAVGGWAGRIVLA